MMVLVINEFQFIHISLLFLLIGCIRRILWRELHPIQKIDLGDTMVDGFDNGVPTFFVEHYSVGFDSSVFVLDLLKLGSRLVEGDDDIVIDPVSELDAGQLFDSQFEIKVGLCDWCAWLLLVVLYLKVLDVGALRCLNFGPSVVAVCQPILGAL